MDYSVSIQILHLLRMNRVLRVNEIDVRDQRSNYEVEDETYILDFAHNHIDRLFQENRLEELVTMEDNV